MTEHEIRLRHFVDQMGVLFVRSGGSVTMGRILGHLLVCRPAEQSLAQIADALGISKASASQLTRQLEQMGLLVRVAGASAGAGARSTWYRMRSGAWGDILREQIALTRLFVEHAESGLALLGDDPAETDRLRDLRDFYVEMEDELTEFVKRYEARHGRKA